MPRLYIAKFNTIIAGFRGKNNNFAEIINNFKFLSMKKRIIFSIILAAFTCMIQASDEYWNVEVKLHRPKNDTSKVFLYSLLQLSTDTIKAVSIKGDKYIFHLPKENQFLVLSSDKYETTVKHIMPEGDFNDKYVDLYLKDCGKKKTFDRTSEMKNIRKSMIEQLSSIGGNSSNEVNVVVVKKQ